MPTIDHFELPVDDIARAQKFYSELLGWQFQTQKYTDFEYTFIKTQTLDGKPGLGGGMMLRQNPGHIPANYVSVESIDATLEKALALGAKVILPKQPVADMGFIALILDTENNPIGFWESTPTSSPESQV
ncbi:MAG: VOC family protein [Candidatus Sericytochromatia bacterium]|nr:VOC family protein [Candidatus Sericytochromatia bacterium]